MAPALRLGFQERVTEVRVTSVTSGLEGALGIRFGSVGLFGWTGTPNSKCRTERGKETGEIIVDCCFPVNPSKLNFCLSHFTCSFAHENK